MALPKQFLDWFKAKGWAAHPHQYQIVEKTAAGHPVLLVAPTGAGKTLSGFLPSLIDLSQTPFERGCIRCIYRRSRRWQLILPEIWKAR